MEALRSWWFEWGAIVFLLLTILIAALVLFDMARQRRTVMGWALGVILPIVIVFPSLIFKALLDQQAGPDPAAEGLENFLLWAGVVAGLVSIVDAIGYFMTATMQPAGRAFGGSRDNPPTIRGGGGGFGGPAGGAGPTAGPGGNFGPGGGGPAAHRAGPNRQSGNALLIQRNGPGGGHQYQIYVPRTTLGRDPSQDVAINDPDISREHALIQERSGRYSIVDRGSTNGTFVRGQRLRSEVYLEDDDLIKLGPSTELIFKRF